MYMSNLWLTLLILYIASPPPQAYQENDLWAQLEVAQKKKAKRRELVSTEMLPVACSDIYEKELELLDTKLYEFWVFLEKKKKNNLWVLYMCVYTDKDHVS